MSGSADEADPPTLEELEHRAKGFGCILVTAKSRELLLDLDDPKTILMWEEEIENLEAPVYMSKDIELVADLFEGITVVDTWKSRSRIGRHVIVRLGVEVPIPVAIALQCALGSDPKREAIACWEYLRNLEANGGNPPVDTRSLFRPDETLQKFMQEEKTP